MCEEDELEKSSEGSQHPPERLAIRTHLIEMANSLIERWDEFADKEHVSKMFGFHFVAR